jgi:hypothetical protein
MQRCIVHDRHTEVVNNINFSIFLIDFVLVQPIDVTFGLFANVLLGLPQHAMGRDVFLLFERSISPAINIDSERASIQKLVDELAFILPSLDGHEVCDELILF